MDEDEEKSKVGMEGVSHQVEDVKNGEIMSGLSLFKNFCSSENWCLQS